ncbi:MAG TPA: Rieske (2Fe-2S) protein [Candidatus Omnitrophota bacterium]|nr:Rieske (2Fe-2S) protein [Candidatus Omnitrophota bacterium]
MGKPWIPVIEEDRLIESSVRLVTPKGLGILLIRKKGSEIYAISNKCPHMGCPLRTGILEGYILTCPCHDWRFDIRTGFFLDAPEISLAVYPVRVADGMISIRL